MGLIVTASDVAWWDWPDQVAAGDLRGYLQREGQRYRARGGPGSSSTPE